MKKIIIFVIKLIKMIAIPPWLPLDKALHFSVCFVTAIFSPMLAIGLAIGKEYGDYNNPASGWSWGDLFADWLGVCVGGMIHGLIIN